MMGIHKGYPFARVILAKLQTVQFIPAKHKTHGNRAMCFYSIQPVVIDSYMSWLLAKDKLTMWAT